MRKRTLLFGMMSIFLLILSVAIDFTTLAASDAQNANRMNVVFVMDQSGSMDGTDGAGLRYDAMDLFLGLATENGNYMGAVLFNDNIVLNRDISLINGSGDKSALSKSVRSVKSEGNTNIGKAIETAASMLKASGNTDLPSAIILLSDGNTYLGEDQERLENSYKSRENAIKTAVEEEYKIYSICLNADNTADPAELRKISEATGGTSVEVKNAEDLKDVFNQFYNIIYSTETETLGDLIIPENGEAEILFDIPKIGVEEANIIITTLNTDTSYVLYKPNGKACTDTELNDMKVTAQTFSVLKIQNPDDGQWKLKVKGIPGDNVKIEMVYNSDIALVQNVNPEGDIFVDTDVVLIAQLLNKGTIVTDDSVYEEYPIYVSITDINTGAAKEYEMDINNHQGEYTFRLSPQKEYDIYSYCVVNGMELYSSTLRVSASNTLPTSKEDLIEIKRIVFPFTDAEYLYNLSSVIMDMEDTILTYNISQSDFDSSLVYVDGENLAVRIKEIGRGGELYVTAADSEGGSVEVHIIIKTISILPFLLLIIAVVIVILILCLIRNRNKVIRGRVQIIPYNEDAVNTPNTQICEGVKGKMRIERCLNVRENIGIDMKSTYFIPGEQESYIYIISKNGYYTDADPDVKNKKICLEGGIEVDISSDIDFTKGMKVTYMPDDMEF